MARHLHRPFAAGVSSITLVASLALVAGCGAKTEATASPGAAGERAPVGGTKCLLVLHGKGGEGGESYVENDVTKHFPAGNASAESWGGRQWIYFPDDKYDEAKQIVTSAVEGCGQVIIGGFSNGAGFAAKLYCRGETLDGRLTGVVLDDPVPDHGTDGCSPGSGIDLTVYWTGALVEAKPGWKCAEADWTCDGGETIGIDAALDHLGGPPLKKSPYTDHQWYYDAPELTAFR